MLFFVRVLRKDSVQLHQVRLITFQETAEFFDCTGRLRFDGLVRVDVLVT